MPNRPAAKKNTIPIIDLFAGPGGLGEGFSSRVDGLRPFRIAVSVEKDPFAHRTLTLRAFYRWFSYNNKPVPAEYYQHLEGSCSLEDLYAQFPGPYRDVQREALNAELGNSEHQPVIDQAIETAVKGCKDWLLIGGPPCQAYSLVGRSRMQNAEDYVRKQGHRFEQDHRHKLYQQYLRVIAMHGPAVFVMENVKGILSAKLDGDRIFPKILEDLRSPFVAAEEYGWKNARRSKYRILSFVTGKEPASGEDTDYLIRAEQYGVPQARHRVILLGIREDVFNRLGGKIKPLEQSAAVAIKSIIGDLPLLRSGFSKGPDSNKRWKSYFRQMRSAKWVKSVDKDVQKKILAAIGILEKGSLAREYSGRDSFVPQALGDWYADNNVKGLPNHETRTHMDSDLDRYLFASSFGAVHNRSPHLKDFPAQLLPDHRNVEYSGKDQKFSDRFKVQLWGQPASTVTSHISKDGHYFIHPDPTQCRSLTVREAARIQTFPDNYYFEGGRTQQYHQVGNAVPPYLAKQLAEIVFNVFKESMESK